MELTRVPPYTRNKVLPILAQGGQQQFGGKWNSKGD